MNITKHLRNNNINSESKLLIGIGDSFCAGSGSESYRTWERNNWDIEKVRYDEVGRNEAYENSFINQLCKKHLTDYTPVNLGISGKGNKFAVRELLLNPTLNLEIAKEKIVIFVVSGFDRFDVAHDIVEINGTSSHSTTLWPTYENIKNKVGYSELTTNSGESIYNEKFVVSELIIDFLTLLNWCELYNAKLLFISGFTPELNMEHFLKWMVRDFNMDFDTTIASKLISKIPWHRQIKPMGFDCITSMLLHLENRDDLIPHYGFRNFKPEKITEHGYMSKCQHPTQKGHELLCDLIFDEIKKYDIKSSPDFYEMCIDFYKKRKKTTFI
jgi:hypothetical protein